MRTEDGPCTGSAPTTGLSLQVEIMEQACSTASTVALYFSGVGAASGVALIGVPG